MKNKVIHVRAWPIIAMALLFATCSKEGPEGPTGPQGDPGPTGTTGPKGETGTANVIYSPWLDVAFRADTVTINSKLDTVGYYALVPAAKLSTAILNTGEIKVYINVNNAVQPIVYPLPHFDPRTRLSINSSFAIQNIYLYANGNISTVTQAGSKYQQYRYILIPGATSGRTAEFALWDNYDEVKRYLDLPD